MPSDSPTIDWDVIDRAVAIMEQQGLRDVRATKHGPHIATVDFNHPPPGPFADVRNIDSSAEVNTNEDVISYTIRFPQYPDGPQSPAPDAISVALTDAAGAFPPGYSVDVQHRARRLGDTMLAPHIRGDPEEYPSIFQFARQAVQAQERFYDALHG